MLEIQIAKRSDGCGVLSCKRADGSTTWQKQTSNTAAHFALHDLTHYAVETTLGCTRAFFGLVADGWEIAETTGKGSRGALPAEALEVEAIVGLFDRERGGANLKLTCEEFNLYSPRRLSEDQIRLIHECRADLFRRWAEVPVGGKLELRY